METGSLTLLDAPIGPKKLVGVFCLSKDLKHDAVTVALTQAFEGLGGVFGLIKWAEDNQTDFYKLWARMMPHEIRERSAIAAKTQGSEIKIEFVSRDGGKTTGTRVTMNGQETAEFAGEEPGEEPEESVPQILPPLPPVEEISNVVEMVRRNVSGEENTTTRASTPEKSRPDNQDPRGV